MSEAVYFLKSNVIAEPLVNNWYAHPYLVSPATSAMFIANSHIKIMESYVNSPQTHEAALEFPEMAGGPFIDFKARQTEQIAKLLNETKERFHYSIQFAAQFKDAAKIIREQAAGLSLDRLYQHLPNLVKGYIELAYDLYGQPNFKLLEPLLYADQLYLKDAQTVMLSLITDDNRPFSLSTPRIENQHTKNFFMLNHSFSDDIYDTLFNSRYQGLSENTLMSLWAQLKNPQNPDYLVFKQLFTTAPRKTKKLLQPTSGIRVRYFGHACLLIETPQTNILLDPAISYHFSNCSERYSYEDLPEKIDYVLITHNHQDHVLIEHLLQLRHKIDKVIVPRSDFGNLLDPSLKLFFNALGFKEVIEISSLESIEANDIKITSIPFLGEHGDFNIMSKTAYCLQSDGRSILCMADSNNLNECLYQKVHTLTGDIDALFISMECEGAPFSWLYGALLPEKPSRAADQSRKLSASDAEKAWKIVKTFNCKQVYLYAMGMESWLSYIMRIDYKEESIQLQEEKRFKMLCQTEEIVFEKLYRCKTFNI
jgi:L-ascorbate metabolism protein UlaG (beta-lactamase superfamily)